MNKNLMTLLTLCILLGQECMAQLYTKNGLIHPHTLSEDNVGIGTSNIWDKLTIEPRYITLVHNRGDNSPVGGISFANRAAAGASPTSNIARIYAISEPEVYAGNLIFEVRSGTHT